MRYLALAFVSVSDKTEDRIWEIPRLGSERGEIALGGEQKFIFESYYAADYSTGRIIGHVRTVLWYESKYYAGMPLPRASEYYDSPVFCSADEPEFTGEFRGRTYYLKLCSSPEAAKLWASEKRRQISI